MDDVGMDDLFDGFNLNGEMIPDGGVGVPVTNVDHLDGHLLLSTFVDSSEDVGPFGEVEMVIQAVGVVLHFLPQLVFHLPLHQ